MADNKPQQQKDNKDAQSGEPVKLDKDQQQAQRKPQPQHEGGQKK